jgi:hypothetical protein
MNKKNKKQEYVASPSIMPEENIKLKKGIPIKTTLLIIFLSFVAFGLFTLALLLNKPAQTDTTVTIPIQTIDPAQTTLTISSTPIQLSTPSSYSSDIVVNTGQNAITKVQLEILYDPKILTNVDVNPGPFFTNPQVLLKLLDKANGRISFALGIQKGEKGVLGQGILAKLEFMALQKNATASVSLLPKTEVTAQGYSQSVLKSTVNALFDLGNIPQKVTPTTTKK